MAKSVKQLELELAEIKKQLKAKEKELYRLKFEQEVNSKYGSTLSSSEICRYSRQILVPNIDVKGQLALCKGKVLIVGAGGLGCPSAMYLASAGVGHITIVDNDAVDLTNLHRQILHYQSDLGSQKVMSVANKLYSMNSNVTVFPLEMQVNSKSLPLLLLDCKYNAVLDCTDNVATRYLLNDACVINKIPLISGSALQLEGQLTVYNYKGGPCYRCLFPVPPPPEAVTSCGDGGIVGPVAGTIGTLQALEAIKIITKMEGVLSQRLLIFDGAETTFRNVKLRPRNVNCAVCGDNPTIKTLINYEEFCGSKANDKVENINILKGCENIDVKTLFPNIDGKLIIDVRSEVEYRMCSLPHTVNYPYNDLIKGTYTKDIEELIARENAKSVYMLCRRGNDSQRAAVYLKNAFSNLNISFMNISGGLYEYAKYIDKNFPIY